MSKIIHGRRGARWTNCLRGRPIMFRRAEFRLASCLLMLLAVVGFVHPAQAQFRGGYAFLQAVDNRDGTKATEALKDDPSYVNTRHSDTGETALIIVTKRSEEHTSELQSLMRISYAVFSLK